MAWKQISINEIPEKQISKARNSWKADVDDATAVFGMILTGGEALIQKMPDQNAACKKAEAMLKWIKTQTLLPATLTVFSRGNDVISTDINLLRGENDD